MRPRIRWVDRVSGDRRIVGPAVGAAGLGLVASKIERISGGQRNFDLGFFIFDLLIVFLIVGPPWERFSVKRDENEVRVAFGPLGLKYWHRWMSP